MELCRWQSRLVHTRGTFRIASRLRSNRARVNLKVVCKTVEGGEGWKGGAKPMHIKYVGVVKFLWMAGWKRSTPTHTTARTLRQTNKYTNIQHMKHTHIRTQYQNTKHTHVRTHTHKDTNTYTLHTNVDTHACTHHEFGAGGCVAATLRQCRLDKSDDVIVAEVTAGMALHRKQNVVLQDAGKGGVATTANRNTGRSTTQDHRLRCPVSYKDIIGTGVDSFASVISINMASELQRHHQRRGG